MSLSFAANHRKLITSFGGTLSKTSLNMAPGLQVTFMFGVRMSLSMENGWFTWRVARAAQYGMAFVYCRISRHILRPTRRTRGEEAVIGVTAKHFSLTPGGLRKARRHFGLKRIKAKFLEIVLSGMSGFQLKIKRAGSGAFINRARHLRRFIPNVRPTSNFACESSPRCLTKRLNGQPSRPTATWSSRGSAVSIATRGRI